MAEKIVNYTAEQTSEIVSRFVAGETKEALALAFGKSVRSITAKLSREGVYKAASKEKAEARVTKAELITKIAFAAGVEEEVLESLEKATSVALKAVLAAIEAE